MAHLDNDGVLGSMRSQHGVKNLRLNVLYLLRNQILDLNGILAQEVSWSQRNIIWRALLSRGLLSPFLEKAKEKGSSQFRADVRRHGVPINLGDLIGDLLTLTNN